MANSREQEVLDVINNQIVELTNVDPEKLSRREELTERINFEEVVPIFKELLEEFRPLFIRDLSKLPYPQLTAIKDAFGLTLGFIKDIELFEITDGSHPEQKRKEIIDAINSRKGTIQQQVLLPLVATKLQTLDISELENITHDSLAKVEKKNKELDDLLEKSKNDAEKTLEAIHQASAFSGVSANSKAFETQARNHNDAAKTWLIQTYASVAITAAVAVFLFFSVPQYTPESVPEAIQYVFAKIVLISTLTFAIVWCSKNYKSHKHNETMYEQKRTTLETFEAFYQGSEDQNVKNVILLQAAYAAFANQQTGFESAHEKDAPPTIQILDVLNKAVRTAEKATQASSHSN